MTAQTTLLVDIRFVTENTTIAGTVYRHFTAPDLQTVLTVLREDFTYYDGRGLRLDDLETLKEDEVLKIRPRLKPITVGEEKIKQLTLGYKEIRAYPPILDQIG